MGMPLLREKIEIEGIMPQRALLRLKRAGIAVFSVQKTQKNRILFSVKKKDVEKVFAIYPNLCYNKNGYSAYSARRVGATGLLSHIERGKKRAGIWLGILLFCAGTLALDGYTFGVRYVGTDVYARETQALLEEYGMSPFSRYQTGSEDAVCAQLLALNGVEFCSVKKSGLWVRVEIRRSPFPQPIVTRGDMQAERSGVVKAITVLKGTALKCVGDSVAVEETLVGGYFQTEDGRQIQTEVVARARIACVYEKTWEAATEQEAFASAYLELALSDKDTLAQSDVVQEGEAFHVKIQYEIVQTMNF